MEYKNTIFINVTPHFIIFRCQDGSEFELLPSGYLVNAKPVEETVSVICGIEFVSTRFQGDLEGVRIIQEIKDSILEKKNILIIGSIVAAQAYPGQVVAMTPAPGYERVPVDQKRMNPDKFTIF